ncbi:MAG: phosphoribosylglycinamide formyltransferase [Flavobacteriales bacterium]|jgi:phosphoribosylglycinamide formyltransferase-1|nr:phosphoribosylglycinamide formyltransferase [Flavobacteriales bacterium]
MKIALFASGTGSNVRNIIKHFEKNKNVEIASVFSNKANAGALLHAIEAGIPTYVFSNQELTDVDSVYKIIEKQELDLIVLAGFLLKIPKLFISKFEGKIINLHPSLLPKFGGKGMYGTHVHRAVLAANELETGITIHYVNENYDKGAIIKQFKIDLTESDNLEAVQEKIKWLEKTYFPITIEELTNKL